MGFVVNIGEEIKIRKILFKVVFWVIKRGLNYIIINNLGNVFNKVNDKFYVWRVNRMKDW